MLALLTRAAFLWIPVLDLDEAAHVVGSWELMSGGRLYTDFADNKPPLLYVYYALAQEVFGRGLPAVRLFTALLTLPLTALALSAFYGHDRRGVAAGVLYLVYGASFYAHDMQAAHAEIPMLLAAAWAVVLLRREAIGTKATLAAGLLLGVACLLKYQAVFWLAAAPLAHAANGQRRRAVRGAATLGAGFLVPLMAAWAAFEATGGSADFLYWTLASNLVYAQNPILPAEALLRAARGFLPFLAVTAPLWWAWRRSADLASSPYERRFLTTLVLLSVPPAFLGFRFYPHYFIQLYAPLALAAAPGVARAFEAPRGRSARLFAAATLVAFVGFTAAGLYLYRARTDVYEETSPRIAAAAAWLRADRCARGSNLFVWGYAPTLYYLTELRPASRFVMPQTSLTGYVAGNTASATGGVDTRHLVEEAHWDLLLRDLEARGCTYVVDTSPSGLHRWNRYPLHAYPRLLRFVTEAFDRVATVEGLVIYRRRGC